MPRVLFSTQRIAANDHRHHALVRRVLSIRDAILSLSFDIFSLLRQEQVFWLLLILQFMHSLFITNTEK